MQYMDDNSPQYINETYKIWKKHAPYLYNFLQVYPLVSPSNTIDSFPSSYLQSDWENTSLLVGSNSLTKNFITIIDVLLPTDSSIIDNSQYQQKPPTGSVGTMGQQILNNRIMLPQNSQIMKARVNKINQNLIACKTGGNDYELSLYNLNYDINVIEDNKIQLIGHDCQGFGLAWHPKKSNIILSGSYDKKVIMWDINMESPEGIHPLLQAHHSDGVQDVKWSENENVMGSVGQERSINIWDIREDCKKPSVSKIAHSGQIYSLDFNSFSEYLMCTGGQDTDIMIWDIRNMSKKIHMLSGHNDSINVVSWSKINPLELISGSSDRKIVVWSLKENVQKSSNKQILFIHGGHRSKITDLTWIKNTNSVGSCQMENIMHVWHMNEKIYLR